MKKIVVVTILSAILLWCIGIHSNATDAALGSFSSLNGPIKYDKEGLSGYSEIAKETALKLQLNEKDMIMSPAGTTGDINTSYGAKINLRQNSEIQLGYYNLRVKQGGAWINYKPTKKDGTMIFKVDTPVGTIGVKGTEFAVCMSGENTVAIQVREGVVGFEGKNGAGEIDITAGSILLFDEKKNVREIIKVEEGVDIFEKLASLDVGVTVEQIIEALGKKTENKDKKVVPSGETGNGTTENPWKQLKKK